MAASIDMFGPGGEGLGGLFVGNQYAQDQALKNAQEQQVLASAAHTQGLANAADLSNQYEGAILQDKVNAYKQAIADKKQAADDAKFEQIGEKFGQLGQTLEGMPAAARPAALKQLAQQSGIPDDNPLLMNMLNMDPEQMPAAMSKFSQGFYEQSNKARAEAQKRDAMLQQARKGFQSREAEGERNRELRRDLAAQASEDRRFLGRLAASSRQAVANAKTSKGTAGMTRDKAIAYLELKQGAEGLTEGETMALENLKRQELQRATVGKTGTEEQVMGTASPEARVEAALSSQRKTKAPEGSGGGAKVPEVGAVVKGYRYKGGDPSKQTSWEKQ